MRNAQNQNKNDLDFLEELSKYFDTGYGTTIEKLSNFTKYIPRQNLTAFLAKYEIFKKIIDVEGAIIECGVRFGGGLMTFAHLSSIFEPVNFNRRIIGFDTFSGFPSISKYDKGSTSKFAYRGGFASDSHQDLKKCAELYDLNRFINHIPRIELIKGDAVRTIPKYLKDNPHLVVSLLYLDFDIYRPTRVALENFVSRMPKGAIIAFDELNRKVWVGETKAVLDTIGINKLKINRFNFEPHISYAVLE